MLLGIGLTFLIPETARRTLEEISETCHGEVDTTKLGRDRFATQEEPYDSEEVKTNFHFYLFDFVLFNLI